MTVSVAAPRLHLRRYRLWQRTVRVILARPELVTALLCAIVLGIGQRGPDLPAQAYRVFLLRHHGLVAFDSHWYAGHPLPGYSLLFPPVAAVLGARLVGALSCVAATAAFTRLLRGRSDRGHDLAVLWFAVVSVVNLVVGRLPFALGVALGLGALVEVRERRPVRAALFALACSCASPLAGAFLLLIGAAWFSLNRSRAVLALSSAFVGIGAAALFGEGGWFPFPWTTLLVIMICVVGGQVLLPRSARLVRRGLVFYGIASVVLFAFHNPIGGNMVRLGAIASGPVLAYELVRARRWIPLGLVISPLLIWQFAPLPTSFAGGRDNPSAHAKYYAGLLAYLRAHGGSATRLEVPLTDGRWEADYLATEVALARGWERQLDLQHNSVLYADTLSARDYHDWLLKNGVGWVAMPDVPLDESEAAESSLVADHTPSYLRPVWHDEHWQLWQVRDARPLVTGPAELLSLDVSSFDLQARSAGRAVVLVRWTRFWRVTDGDACVSPTPDGWTAVQLERPGRVTVSAKVGLGALAGSGGKGSCSD